MEKAIILKKNDKCFKCGKFGYSATSIVRKMVYSLGLQFTEPKTCNIRLKNHIEAVLCKKTVIKRTSHLKNVKCLKSSKLRVAFFTKATLAFCFFLFFLPHLNCLQIFTNWLFLALLKMVSFLEY